jgi:hypothetical protein
LVTIRAQKLDTALLEFTTGGAAQLASVRIVATKMAAERKAGVSDMQVRLAQGMDGYKTSL